MNSGVCCKLPLEDFDGEGGGGQAEKLKLGKHKAEMAADRASFLLWMR
jgi:hypothetical protein